MDETMVLFVRISIHRMTENYLPKLSAAIRALDQQTLWTHEVEWMNSIGGIVMHICEHVNRHIVRYSGSGPVTGGIENHFPDLGLQPEELVVKATDAFSQWKSTMSAYIGGQSDMRLLDMHDVFHLVEHTGYHLGQIVDRTQRLTDTKFQFVQNGMNEKNLKQLLNRGI